MRSLALALTVALTLAGCSPRQSTPEDALAINGAATAGFAVGQIGVLLIAEYGTPADFEAVAATLSGVMALLAEPGFDREALDRQLVKLPTSIRDIVTADLNFVIERWAPTIGQQIDKGSFAWEVVRAVMDGFATAITPTMRSGQFAMRTEPLPTTVMELRALIHR